MKRIGDISIQDAELLARYASTAQTILEFGVGASTQVMAMHGLNSKIVSVDTQPAWIEKTKKNFTLLGIKKEVTYIDYQNWHLSPHTNLQFDIIFDDGFRPKRLEFAFTAWSKLKVGGVLMFHDTRITEVQGFVLKLVEKYYNEIESIQTNESSSNITVIKKKTREPYVNWNHVEKREPWEVGAAEPPPGLWKK